MSETSPSVDPRASLPRHSADQMPLVTSFDEVHELFTHHAFGQAGHDDSADFIGDTVVTLNGDAHRERLRIEKTLFTRESLAYYETAVLLPAVEQALSSLKSDGDGLVHVDLVPLGRKILTQIAATIIGLDDVGTGERADRLAYLCGRLAQGSRLKFAIGDVEQLRRDLLAEKEEFIADYVVASRRRREELIGQFRSLALREEDLPRDLLTLLLLNARPEWDDDLINREVILFLVASTLTTAMSVPHAVYHIDHWIREHPEDEVKLQDGEFLRAAAYESMRLHASSPLQIRRALEPADLKTGTHIEVGTDVAISAAVANRDATVYGADADRFNPYRRPANPRFQLYGHTFAAGEHRCLGEHLAAGMRPSRDKDNGTFGMVLSILSGLYRRGVRLDPEHPPQQDPATTSDFYSSCPIVFRAGAA